MTRQVFTNEPLKVELENYSSLYVFPLSDIHYGNKYCNEDFFDVWLEVFRQCKGEKIIYLLGDLLETPTSKFSSYDASMTTNEAMEEIVKKLKPFQDYIRYSVSGNHELRTSKEFNYDVGLEIANRLYCPHSRNDFFDTLYLNGKRFTIYGLHGVSTSRSSDLSLRKFKTESGIKIANLHLQGHNHYSKFDSEYIRTSDGGHRNYYCFTGHFINYKDSYAHNKQYNPSPCSFQRIAVDENGICQTQFYNADEIMEDYEL